MNICLQLIQIIIKKSHLKWRIIYSVNEERKILIKKISIMSLKMTREVESDKENEMNVSLKTTLNQLENLFKFFNKEYFENQLEAPVITISPDMTKGAYGWCTSWKAWKHSSEDGENDGHYEINICAEHLTRPFEEVAGTMLHEMVHLDNLYKGIKDTSRSGTYHNEKFRKTAEKHGLIVEKTEKYGFAITKLTDEAKEKVKKIGCESFDMFRDSGIKKANKTSKSSSIKYVCPLCGAIIRATKEVNVRCADCGVLFEKAE